MEVPTYKGQIKLRIKFFDKYQKSVQSVLIIEDAKVNWTMCFLEEVYNLGRRKDRKRT